MSTIALEATAAARDPRRMLLSSDPASSLIGREGDIALLGRSLCRSKSLQDFHGSAQAIRVIKTSDLSRTSNGQAGVRSAVRCGNIYRVAYCPVGNNHRVELQQISPNLPRESVRSERPILGNLQEAGKTPHSRWVPDTGRLDPDKQSWLPGEHASVGRRNTSNLTQPKGRLD